MEATPWGQAQGCDSQMALVQKNATVGSTNARGMRVRHRRRAGSIISTIKYNRAYLLVFFNFIG